MSNHHVEYDSREEWVALVEHTIHHNEHHIQELSELAEELSDEESSAKTLFAMAIENYQTGTIALKEALRQVQEHIGC